LSAYLQFCQRLFRQNEFAIKLGLGRMRNALEIEGSPDASFSSILIAGTNGKGSVACLAHAALLRKSCRIGLYTSPHLVDVRERIRVNGIPISEPDFMRIGSACLERWSDEVKPGERLTYFELLTLIAALYFKEQEVELALFEVGLGGRFDATNVISPIGSCITQVGLDHQQYLGDSIEDIFPEKLGVLREDRPNVVCLPTGWSVSRTVDFIRNQTEVPQDYCLEGRDFGVDDGEIWVHEQKYKTEHLPLTGAHQQLNAACALMLCKEISARDTEDTPLPREVLSSMSRARWPGRWSQIWIQGRAVWLDGAHNPSSIAAVSQIISSQFSEGVTLIFGAAEDKDVKGMLRCLKPVTEKLIFTLVENQRAMSTASLCEIAGELGMTSEAFEGSDEAIARALEGDNPIIVLGSLYLVGEIYQMAAYSPEDLHIIESTD
jgi:folylpolyglutamate synthase/dihydrofolate synthase